MPGLIGLNKYKAFWISCSKESIRVGMGEKNQNEISRTSLGLNGVTGYNLNTAYETRVSRWIVYPSEGTFIKIFIFCNLKFSFYP